MDPQVDIAKLAKLLEGCRRVGSFGSQEDPEAWALAHALVDISESCDKISRELLGALIRAKNDEAIEDVLHDIGEELRHIQYHVSSSRFYRYLKEDGDATAERTLPP